MFYFSASARLLSMWSRLPSVMARLSMDPAQGALVFPTKHHFEVLMEGCAAFDSVSVRGKLAASQLCSFLGEIKRTGSKRSMALLVLDLKEARHNSDYRNFAAHFHQRDRAAVAYLQGGMKAFFATASETLTQQLLHDIFDVMVPIDKILCFLVSPSSSSSRSSLRPSLFPMLPEPKPTPGLDPLQKSSSRLIRRHRGLTVTDPRTGLPFHACPPLFPSHSQGHAQSQPQHTPHSAEHSFGPAPRRSSQVRFSVPGNGVHRLSSVLAAQGPAMLNFCVSGVNARAFAAVFSLYALGLYQPLPSAGSSEGATVSAVPSLTDLVPPTVPLSRSISNSPASPVAVPLNPTSSSASTDDSSVLMEVQSQHRAAENETAEPSEESETSLASTPAPHFEG